MVKERGEKGTLGSQSSGSGHLFCRNAPEGGEKGALSHGGVFRGSEVEKKNQGRIGDRIDGEKKASRRSSSEKGRLSEQARLQQAYKWAVMLPTSIREGGPIGIPSE